MIQDLTFGGSYKDKNMSIEAMLVNPAEHGYGNTMLTFKLDIKTEDIPINLHQWHFYILNYENSIINAADFEEKTKQGLSTITLILVYHLHYEYFYNDIKLGFLYEPYNRIEFIEIKH